MDCNYNKNPLKRSLTKTIKINTIVMNKIRKKINNKKNKII